MSSSRSRCQLGSVSLKESLSVHVTRRMLCYLRRGIKHVAKLNVLRLLNRDVRAHSIKKQRSELSYLHNVSCKAYTELGFCCCCERVDTVGSG